MTCMIFMLKMRVPPSFEVYITICKITLMVMHLVANSQVIAIAIFAAA